MEGDKAALARRALEEWALVHLFRLVIESSASEQNARFRAMDAATSNLRRLIDELTLGYHVARQHAITMEMLDLVAGAGMLRGPRGRQRR
jgi:F-type H+-transporting ATPase subunit gamma